MLRDKLTIMRKGGIMVNLTPRELDCLRLAAQGNSNIAIGHELGISHQTVKNHLWNTYRKLFGDSRHGQQGKRTLAIFYALRTGQISWREI